MKYLSFAALALFIGCADNSITSPSASPSPTVSPSPSSNPTLRAIVNVVATQGGENNIVTSVATGSQFKYRATATSWFVDGAIAPAPAAYTFDWKQTNAPLGVCGISGNEHSATIAVVCVDPTFPVAVDFEGCVMSIPDETGTVINYGCGSYGVYID